MEGDNIMKLKKYTITLREIRPDGSKGIFPPAPHCIIEETSEISALITAGKMYGRIHNDIKAQEVTRQESKEGWAIAINKR
jgi:hypothetical protein